MNLSRFATRFTWSLVSSILESFLLFFVGLKSLVFLCFAFELFTFFAFFVCYTWIVCDPFSLVSIRGFR